MKIGIITWFTYENYGTKLQAFALQHVLREQGHTVSLINFDPVSIIPKRKKALFAIRIFNYLRHFQTKILRKVVEKDYRDDLRVRKERFETYISENCILTEHVKSKEDYIDICNSFDLIICGSDQIWNPNIYHPYYFAGFPEIVTRRISYAPSFGVNDILDSKKKEIIESLNFFDVITVREKKATEIIEMLIDKKAECVVDPTFLMDEKEWSTCFQIKEKKEIPYVLCYFLSDNGRHFRAAEKFAKEKKLLMKVIPGQTKSFFMKGEKCVSSGPRDFLELIKNAEYVLTDSFHGTLFSMLFGKQFYTFVRFKENNFASENSRIYQIVDEYKLQNRLVTFNSKVIIESANIDYEIINRKMKENIVNSKRILNEAVMHN